MSRFRNNGLVSALSLRARCILLSCVFFVVGGNSLILHAQDVGEGGKKDLPVTAELIADRASVATGGFVRFGVLFKIAPHWHIYWKNPGETGFATKIEWDVSELTTATVETMYPAPMFFRGAGGVASYGYEKEVLLFVTVRNITPAGGAKSVTARAKARWLMCREDECRDGRTSISLTLPIGQELPTNRELFDSYRALVPVAGTPDNLRVDSSTTPDGISAELRLDVPAGTLGVVAEDTGNARGLFFFPYAVKGAVVDLPRVRGTLSEITVQQGRLKVYSEEVTISLSVRRSSSTTHPLSLSGVLVQQFVREDGTLTSVDVRELSVVNGK